MSLTSGLLSLLRGSGQCSAKECPTAGVTLPNASLKKCLCGCDKNMCTPCVIRHNRDISRKIQVNRYFKKNK